MSLAVIIGPPLAAPLFFSFGVQWALALNALSFAVSFVAILLVHAPPAARSVQLGQKGNARAELIAGLRFVAQNRVLRTLLIAAVLAMAGAGALNALDYFFVVQNLHTSPHLYGWLSAAFGAGAIVGAILCSVYAERIGPTRLFSVGMLTIGVGMLVYSRLATFWGSNHPPGSARSSRNGRQCGDHAHPPAGDTPRDDRPRPSVLQPAISLASIVLDRPLRHYRQHCASWVPRQRTWHELRPGGHDLRCRRRTGAGRWHFRGVESAWSLALCAGFT